MDRRRFLGGGVASAVVAGLRFPTDATLPLLPATAARRSGFDLVAVKGGEPDAMFREGINALGGIGAFVRKGQKVVVKPNIGWDVSPERAGNTNPKLVREIVRQCKDAGAREVVVLDHTCDSWERCYRTSGIESAAKDAGAVVAPAHSEGYYHDVTVPAGKVLRSAKEHEAILGADVFINVPVLKSHGSTRLTVSMKNMMGNVWDRRYWHANDLHQCIADFATYRKPALNVVDAYAVMKDNGPRGVSTDDVVLMKAQLLTTDCVTADAAAAKLFGLNPSDIRHIVLAAEQKVGRMDLDALSIKRISL